MLSINERLISQFDNFRKSSTFVDVVLRSNEEEYLAHRLYLAKYSKWFRNYFNNEEESGKKLSANERLYIDLEVNPNKAMKTILDAIYGGRLQLTIDNAPDLLKVTVFYEFDSLAHLIRDYIKATLYPETCLEYTKQLIQYDLIDDAKSLCNYIATHFVEDIFNPSIPHQINKKKVFEMVTDGRVFAEILKNQVFQEGYKVKDSKNQEATYKLTEEEIVEMIDQYVGDRVVSSDEQAALASVINWSSDSSYKYLVHHRCDWVPPQISRSLYSRILDYRRDDVHTFETDSSSAAQTLSRWFPFSWIQYIADANPTKQTPVVYVNQFISTLGGCAQQFNPIEFGLINAELKDNEQYRGLLISPDFKTKNIVEDTVSCFAAYSNPNGPPSAILNYGKSVKIQSEELYIDPCVLVHENSNIPAGLANQPKFQPVPESISVSTNNSKPTEVPLRKPDQESLPTIFPYNDTFNTISYTLVANNKYQILRLNKVDIKGKFLPQ